MPNYFYKFVFISKLSEHCAVGYAALQSAYYFILLQCLKQQKKTKQNTQSWFSCYFPTRQTWSFNC